jgi:hypothetical protein
VDPPTFVLETLIMATPLLWLRDLIASNRTRRRGAKRGRKPWDRNRAFLELLRLEDRMAPAVQLTYGGAGTDLWLHEVAPSSPVTVSIAEPTAIPIITIDLGLATFAQGSSTTPGVTYFMLSGQQTADPTLASAATVDISAAGNIANLWTTLPGDTLQLGNIADTSGGIDNLGTLAEPISAGAISITGVVDTTHFTSAGYGNITLQADQNILVTAELTTSAGNINLQANTTGTAPGNFSGIDVNNAAVQSTGSGSITLNGTGGSGGAGRDDGIDVGNGAMVQALGTGSVTLTGTGGQGSSSTNSNYGVFIQNSGTQVTTAGGALSVTGTGGQGGNAYNLGINLYGGALVAVQGGAGSLTMTGTGRGSGPYNWGIIVQPGVLVKVMPSAGGIGGTGSLTLTGTGGNGTDDNYGVYLTGSSAQVTTAGGPLSVFGYGGQGTTGYNRGIVENGAVVSVTAGTGKLTLNGTAGGGTNYGAGVYLTGSTTQVTTAGGDLAITGTGKGSTTNNDGIDVLSGARVAAADGGNVFLTGYGGNGGTSLDVGIQVQGGAAVQATGTGGVTLNGTAGNGTSATNNNYGVYIQSSGTQVTTAGGALSITGNAGQGGNANNIGIDLTTSALVAVQGGAGSLTMTGTGRGTGHDNYGIVIQAGAVAKVMPSAGGTGGTGSLTLNGTGGNGSYANYGVYFTGSTMQVSTVGGALSVFGYGGQGVYGGNIGIEDYNAGLVSVTAGTGKLTLNGTAGSGTNVCAGVYLYGSTTQVTTAGGDLSITGTGKGSTNNCDGIDVMSGAKVSAAGGGNVSLTGYGGNGGTALDLGVQVNGAIVQATGGSGSVTLNGTGGAGTSATVSNYGVIVQGSGAQVTTAGGALTITGTGGQGAKDYNIGVDVYHALVAVQGGTGNLTLGGTGGGTGANNWGITLQAGAVVQVVPSSQGTGGTGTLTLGGIGGNGTNYNDGVYITSSGTKVTTARSPLIINGTGQGSGYDNTGIEIGYGTLVSAGDSGSLSLNGTGGNGTSGNVGVDIYAGTTTPTTQVSTTAGALSITGVGRGSGTNNYGIWVEAAARVSAGTGALTLTGTGGNGTDSDYGVLITDAGTLVSTTDGALTIIGTAGAGTNSYAIGLLTGVTIQATGSGNIFLYGDSLNMDPVATPASINAGSNTVTIDPLSDIPLDLGGKAGVSPALSITEAEVNQITARTIIFGTITSTLYVSDQIVHNQPAGTPDPNFVLGSGGSLIFTPNSSLTSTNGYLTLGATHNILFNPGSSLTSTNGQVSISGLAYGASSVGIEVNDATIQTGPYMYLQGVGGNSSAGNYGIYIHGGAVVQTTGGSSELDMFAYGGSGASDNVGMRIDGNGTRVTAAFLNVKALAGDSASPDVELTNGGLLQGAGYIVGSGVSGNITNGGVLSPGAPGLLEINPNYTQTAGGDLEIRIGGTAAGSQYDQLNVAGYNGGAVNLAGTLGVQLINGFTPSPDQTFTIVTGASVAGTFAGMPDGGPVISVGGPDPLRIMYLPTSVVLTYLVPAQISTLSPDSVWEGSGYATGHVPVTINGSNFVQGATVQVNGKSLDPGLVTFDSNAQLEVQVPASYVSDEGMNPTVTVTNPYTAASNSLTLTVTDAPLTPTAQNVSPTAGAPFSGVVTTFTDADPGGTVTDYTAVVSLGDGTSMTVSSAGVVSSSTPTASGKIITNANGGFSVQMAYTYANPGTYPITVTISDAGGFTTSPVTSTASVTMLGIGVQKGQGAGIGFWHNNNGQKLITSFGTTATGLTLANWLAATCPDLFGINAPAFNVNSTIGTNLTGRSNSDVAAYFLSLFRVHGQKTYAQVLATALNVYATTLSLGGQAAKPYGFTIDQYGLGASGYNVGSNGAAFGVKNNTTLTVYALLKDADAQVVNGVLYNGDPTLTGEASSVFSDVNSLGGL